MPPAIPALATFTPLSPDLQVGINSLIALLLSVLALVSFFRRKPPLDSELVELKAAISSLSTTVVDLVEQVKAVASHASEIDALKDKVARLDELREEDQRANRTYTRESGERLYKKVDELAASVAANFQAVERALGKLEGKVDELGRR